MNRPAVVLLAILVPCLSGITACSPDTDPVDAAGDGGGDGGGDADVDSDADADGGPDSAPEVGPDAEPDAEGGPDADVAGRTRACSTEIAYERRGGELTVQLAGEWDWASPEEMALVDGSFRIEKDLEPGLYCYKLVINDEWGLDPDNPYRAYCDGVENSGLRVPDRTLPLLTVESAGAEGASFSARIVFSAGCGGPGPEEVTATVVHDFAESAATGAWDEGDWSYELELTGLEPGKHTVRVDATDLDGTAAETLLLPFWIEPSGAEPWSWEDALIYMVLTDRFANGDESNDPAATADAEPTGDWMGGDLAGVTAAIESGYFDDLGVRALWLTPFNTGADGAFLATDGAHLVTGYHGYWPVEPRAVDPRLGTEDDLRELVVAAHGHGIRVLMDLVVNHVHEDHVYYRDHADWFNDGCICGSGGCDWTAERLTCLFTEYMPDVDWRNEAASEQLIADALWWLETFDLDGFRIDAVKHVDDGAVFNLGTRIEETFEGAGTDYYLDGETAMGWAGDDLAANLPEYETISRYIGPGGLDGQFDFVLYHAVVERVFAGSERGLVHLGYWTEQSTLQYPEGAVMTPFVGSHDSSRLLSLSDPAAASVVRNKWPDQGLPVAPDADEPYDRVRLAFCWLLTVPGAPLMYMGDELGEFGGADPDNRHPMRFSGLSAREADLLADVSDLGQARQALRPLRRGGYANLASTETFLAYARETDDGETVVVALNAEASETSQPVPLDGTGLAGEATLAEQLGWGGSSSVDGTTATLTVPPRSCALFTTP